MKAAPFVCCATTMLAGCWTAPPLGPFHGTYRGVGTYSATLSDGTTPTGQIPLVARVESDIQVEFGLECPFTLFLTSFDGGAGTSSLGEGRRSGCVLPLDGGVITLSSSAGGGITAAPDETPQIEIAGPVSFWVDRQVDPGVSNVDIQFQGARTSDQP